MGEEAEKEQPLLFRSAALVLVLVFILVVHPFLLGLRRRLLALFRSVTRGAQLGTVFGQWGGARRRMTCAKPSYLDSLGQTQNRVFGWCWVRSPSG